MMKLWGALFCAVGVLSAGLTFAASESSAPVISSVTLNQAVHFTLDAGAGDVLVPAGTTVPVETVNGDSLLLHFGPCHATVPTSQTDYAERIAHTSAPTASSSDAGAPTQTPDAFISQFKVPLTPTQRASLAREGLDKNQWRELSHRIGAALLTDTKSGYVDQLPWISRLRLAQAFAWLGTPEKDFAEGLAARTFRQNFPQRSEAQVQSAVQSLFATTDAQRTKILIELLGDADNLPRDGILAARIKPETLVALLTNEALMNCLGETATLDDYQPGVWRVLADLQEHNPDGVADLPALAVAMAVVHDQAFPPDWPHRQVAREKIFFVWNNWNELFDYFVQGQHDRSFLTDLSALRADQLRFLVDLPLPRSELEWARQHVHFSRHDFEKAFFSISYDKNRLHDGIFAWPLPKYTLAEISAHGGICVDQAYFAAMAGKANGLPTLFFTGQGNDGGHAWFGFLKEDNRWFLDAGRYAAENFVTGIARDPQNWKPINDHQLAFLSDPGDSLTLYHYSRNLLALATLPDVCPDAAQRQHLLDAALEVDPKLPEIWEAVAEVLRETNQSDLLLRHYEKMAEQFAGQDDLKVEALRAELALEAQAGRTDQVNALLREILESRSDLALGVAGEMLAAQVNSGDTESAGKNFSQMVTLFQARQKKETLSRGLIFFNLVVPYVLALDQQKQDDLAEKAVADAKMGFDLEGAEKPGMPNTVAPEIEALEKHLATRSGKETPAKSDQDY